MLQYRDQNLRFLGFGDLASVYNPRPLVKKRLGGFYWSLALILILLFEIEYFVIDFSYFVSGGHNHVFKKQ
jgi:hypothetical protein